MDQTFADLELPDRVYVYRNLHRTGPGGIPVYSVRDTATGRVHSHTGAITVHTGHASVGKKGNERVRTERTKNVHAGLYGYPTTTDIHHQLSAINPYVDFTDGHTELVDGPEVLVVRAATYNPYQHTTFVDRHTGAELHRFHYAHIGAHGVLYVT